LIEVRNLSKVYGARVALCDVSFKITNGRVYGLLGADGAGKTTLLHLLAGCLAPTEGCVKINGFDLQREPLKAKRCLGYLPAASPLYDRLTVWEYLSFVAEAKGVSYERAVRQVEEVMELTGILSLQKKLIRRLSEIQRRRTGLAQALLGNPEIVLLDEPTVGLTPAQCAEMRALICRLGELKTVIVSSQSAAEIGELCDRVLILEHGSLTAIAEAADLRKGLLSCAGCTKDEASRIKEEAP